ncbi:hypothetical protein HDF16_005735, partial [Granulicella aggregans]|nr:hypothetical protein [Granulicella aggregans]
KFKGLVRRSYLEPTITALYQIALGDSNVGFTPDKTGDR